MKDSYVIFVLCAVAILIGGYMYFKAPEASVSNMQNSGQPVVVAFSEIASGTQATETEQKNYAVYAADAFIDIWNKIGKPPPPPKVDFNKQDVIAVFAGQQPTGGYSIKIEKIIDEAGKRIVSILLTKPGKNCVTTQSITTPFDLVAAPASAFTPTRQVRTEVVDCE